MYSDITVAMVLWNEGHRIRRLMDQITPYFEHIAVGVQESTDNTLPAVYDYTRDVVVDSHRGFGDATFGPKVLPLVKTTWTLKLDGDEYPTTELLESLDRCLVEIGPDDGAWLKFRSWIEGIEWESFHSHLRLFRTALGWPAKLHSRPMTNQTIAWNEGWIEHRRTLDEMVRDYLGYLAKSEENKAWITHNTEMIWHACAGTARVKGWEFIQAHSWWPEVQAKVFQDGLPEPAVPEL